MVVASQLREQNDFAAEKIYCNNLVQCHSVFHGDIFTEHLRVTKSWNINTQYEQDLTSSPHVC